MAEPAKAPTTSTEAYSMVEKQIRLYVHRFRKQYGGDYDELLSEANLVFCEVWRLYSPSKGSIEAWTAHTSWTGLTDLLRKRLTHQHLFKRKMRDLYRGEYSPEWVERLMQDLSGEAVELVKVILQLDEATGRPKTEAKWTEHGDQIRVRAIGELARKGWSGDMIVNAFTEVEEALA